jgi:hypothetical protein
VYETMLAVEDLLDTALTGLAPLIQSAIADNEHTHIGRRSPDRDGRH